MARASVVPDAIDALVAIAAAAVPSGVRVIDGYDMSGDPSDVLMIGSDDPNAVTWTNMATAQQDWANATKQSRNETATITCVAAAFSGDGDIRAARNAAYAYADALGDAIRANVNLVVPDLFPTGVTGVWKTNFFTTSGLTQVFTGDGAAALLVFGIQVFVRI